MVELWHAASYAAPAAPAVGVFSSCPGKWVLNINMGGWTKLQSSLGRGNVPVAGMDVQKAGAFKLLMIPAERTRLSLSFWVGGETWLGLTPISPGLQYVVIANPLSEQHLAQRASWLRAYVLQIKAEEEGGGFLSETLSAIGLRPYISHAPLIPRGDILLNVLITFQKFVS